MRAGPSAGDDGHRQAVGIEPGELVRDPENRTRDSSHLEQQCVGDDRDMARTHAI